MTTVNLTSEAEKLDSLEVLLVEDDLAMATLTSDMLGAGGAHVTRVPTLRAAMTTLRVADFDCVILDLHLPDAVGAAVLSPLRQAFPSTPVMVLSGMDAAEVMRLGLTLGAQVSISKDLLDAEMLWGAVTTAIGREANDTEQVYNHRLARLVEIAGEKLSVSERIDAALTDATAQLRLECGIVSRIDGEEYVVEHVAGMLAVPGQVLDLGRTYCSAAVAGQSVVAIHDIADSSVVGHPSYEARPMDSYIGAPLDVDGRRYGTINFSSSTAAVVRFGRRDREYVRRLALLIGGWVHERDQQKRLDDATQRFQLAFDNAPIGMAVVATDGTLIQVNDVFASVQRCAAADLEGMPVRSIIHIKDQQRVAEFMHDLSGGTIQSDRIEHRFVRSNGELWWGQVHASVVNDDEGNAQYYVAQVEDFTERRMAQKRLTEMALHDALTGLPNRVLLQDRLEHELAMAARDDVTTAVLFLDLDRFKHVNDSLGHAAGDELLKVIADRLMGAVRPNDTVARLGGDEFVVLCGRLDGRDDLTPVIDRIHRVVNEPVVVNGQEVQVGVSIGVSFAEPCEAVSPADLLRNADTAMYRAKGRGRGRAETFNMALRDSAVDRTTIERDLRAAIDRTVVGGPTVLPGLLLHYQPVHDSATGAIYGVEALLRWEHAERGLVGPDEFLQVAEETSLIRPLGRWVIAQALHDWADADQLMISVNHSVQELSAPGFCQHVLDQLAASGVPAGRLCIEVTESSILYAHGSAMTTLRELASHGIQLAIDDFGAGYTSLAHLTESPFTELKLDRSFIVDAAKNDWAIVEAIVRVCEALGLSSVAEGVEDDVSLQRIRATGCERTQGYLHSRPVPLETARGLLPS